MAWWKDVAEWVMTALVTPFLVFLLVLFYKSIKPAREAAWYAQVDKHIREADVLIERFIQVEARLEGLAREVASNQVLVLEERSQILASIGDLHQKLDRLLERLLDQVSGKA